MPRNTFVLEPLPENPSTKDINSRIEDLNRILSDINILESELRGEDGFTTSFSSNIDLNGNRITNLVHSESGTDAVNRDEVRNLIKKQIGTDNIKSIRSQSSLTDSTTGTSSSTINDVGAAHNQSLLNNNFASIISRINDMTEALNQIIQTLSGTNNAL